MVGVSSLVGSSEEICRLRNYLGKLARSDANVLITGDTGTGKECVAQIIHEQGPRCDHPFVAVNCAAIPEALFESEMFGHEAGAFTGALHRREGKLSQATGGTIFLDEIGDLSLLGQAKLLRALETREVTPIGGSKSSAISVRFIAATNFDLESQVQQRQFRADLFFRLNVARLNLQPLRQRKEDIPELFEHFVSIFNQRYQRKVGRASSQLLHCLLSYDWPGNVREIRNLVEAIFIDPPSGEVLVDNLPESFRRVLGRFVTASTAERDRLVLALHQTNWNKKRAAEQMNWSRMTLYRKMSHYKINKPNQQ